MRPGGRALLLLGGGLLLTGCQSLDRGPETREVGESVLDAAETRTALRGTVDFERHVRPILEVRCLHCHDGKEMPGKYNLSTRFEAFKDGRIVPGNAAQSLVIITLTTGNHALSMPAVGAAPAREDVEVLRRWIHQGASWPEGATLRPR